MKSIQLQQGDVVLRRMNAMPKGEIQKVPRDARGIVLAEGEVTGHYHGIRAGGIDAELIRIGDKMLLKLEKQATLLHQEHKPVTIPPGLWEVGRVQEYDYLTQMARPVAD